MKSMARTWVPLLLLLTLAGNSIAQTKEETETWIIKQTEVNPYELKHSIEGSELISSMTLAGAGITGSGAIQKAIPISQVTTITYTHTSEYLSYTMMCDKPCAYLLDDPDQKRPKFLFEIYKKLDAGYLPRMNSALLNLVKLHGGKAKVVKAEVPKQAF
jgi:hypothetical protein